MIDPVDLTRAAKAIENELKSSFTKFYVEPWNQSVVNLRNLLVKISKT